MGYYFKASEDRLIETYKNRDANQASYEWRAYELDMKNVPIAKRKKQVILAEVRTSWGKPVSFLITNPEEASGKREIITLAHDIKDNEGQEKFIAKRVYSRSLANYRKVVSYLACPWIRFNYTDSQSKKNDYEFKPENYGCYSVAFGLVVGEIVWFQNLNRAAHKFEWNVVTMFDGSQATEWTDKLNRLQFSRYAVSKNPKGGYTTNLMHSQLFTFNQWLGCSPFNETYTNGQEYTYSGFKGIFNAGDAKHYFVFYGRSYYEFKHDIIDNCFYIARQHKETYKVGLPIKLQTADGQPELDHKIRFELLQRMYVKNLRSQYYYTPLEDTFQLSTSSSGDLQARRIAGKSKLITALRKCPFQTLLVENRYVFCFYERTYQLMYDMEKDKTVVNAQLYTHEELFYKMWPSRSWGYRYLVAIIDWKENWFVFVSSNWMFVFSSFSPTLTLIPKFWISMLFINLSF